MTDELRSTGAADDKGTAVSAPAETAKVTTAEPSVTPGRPVPAPKKMVGAGR